MNQRSVLKKVVGALAAVGLLSGLAISSGSAPVNAATGPFYPLVEIGIAEDSLAGSFDILDGQTVEVMISTSLNDLYSGWSSNPTQFSMANFSLGTLPADVDIDDVNYYWSANNSASPGTCSQSANSSVATVTFTLTVGCKDDINYVYGQVEWVITNNSGTDQTIDTNSESAHIIVGGSNATADSPNLSASVQELLDASGVEIPTNAGQYFTLSWGMGSGQLCVDSSVTSGDLDIQRDIALDGTPVDVYSFGSGQTAYYTDYMGSGSTFSVSYPSMSVQRQIGLNVDASHIGDILTASLDLTLAGVSKLSDSCGGGGGGGGGGELTQPVVASGAGSLTGRKGAGKGKWSTVKNLPAGFPAASIMNGSTAGPLGDMFYYGLDSNGDAVISRLKSTGAAKIGGATTKLTLDLASGETISNFGWYGAKKDKYVLVTRLMGASAGYKVYLGNLANATGRSSKTIAASQLASSSGMCGTSSAMFSTLRVISAPTTAPIMYAYCGLMSGEVSRLGKLVVGSGAAATVSAYASFTPTDEKPCVYTSYGVNTSASGAKRALVIYSALGAEGDPFCDGSGVTSRKLITVSTAGVATAKTINSAVFGSSEPGALNIVPGKALNSWLAVAYSPDSMSGPGGPNKMFTISASGTVSGKASITLGASTTIFAATGGPNMDYLLPVKELNNGKWMVVRIQYGALADTKSIALATVNPQNGSFTYGEGIKFTSYQRNSGAYIDNHSIAPSGQMSYYFSNAAGKFKVATWTSFTK